MLYGITSRGKERATKDGSAICPECAEPLIPKCGEINIWHWAHRPGSDCDYDPGEMCAWHIDWQDYFDAEHTEVTKINPLTGVKVVADAVAHDGTAIEFQHSSINIETIQTRDREHTKIVWVFDATEYGNDRLWDRGKFLEWRHPRKTWRAADKSIYDRGNGKLWVVDEYIDKDYLRVYGYWVDKDDFIHWALTGRRRWEKPNWTKNSYLQRWAYARNLSEPIAKQMLSGRYFPHYDPVSPAKKDHVPEYLRRARLDRLNITWPGAEAVRAGLTKTEYETKIREELGEAYRKGQGDKES